MKNELYLSSFILVLLWNTFNGSSSMDVLLTSRYSSQGRFWNDSFVKSSENYFRITLTLQLIRHHYYELLYKTQPVNKIEHKKLQSFIPSYLILKYLRVPYVQQTNRSVRLISNDTKIYLSTNRTNDLSRVLSLTFWYSHFMRNLQEEIEFE